MANNKAISEVVGRIGDAAGTSEAVYRALRPLLCASCVRSIAEGELFTRREIPGQHLRILPQCTACTPLPAFTEKTSTRSALIEALLSPAREMPSSGSHNTTTTPQATPKMLEDKAQASRRREKAEHEVQRRLGPALSRRRR